MTTSEAKIDNSIVTNSDIPSRPAVYVRMTGEEYLRLANDASVLGKTLPELVKDRALQRPQVIPLLSATDRRALFAELGRIGNNMNQIARHLNSGVRAGFSRELAGIQEQLTMLRSFFVGKYANAAPAKAE